MPAPSLPVLSTDIIIPPLCNDNHLFCRLFIFELHVLHGFDDNRLKEIDMKYRHDVRAKNAELCVKVIKILHTEGIESAQAWLDDIRKNDLYDLIEQEYLRKRKIIFIN